MSPIAKFLGESPKARIDLDRVGSEVQVSEVANGKADIGILRLPVLRRDPGGRIHRVGKRVAMGCSTKAPSSLQPRESMYRRPET